MGHTAAALAAASVALSRMSTSDAASFSAQTLTAATELYVLAAANEGLYSNNFIPNQKVFLAHLIAAHNDMKCRPVTPLWLLGAFVSFSSSFARTCSLKGLF